MSRQRTIAITGASRGIGADIARHLAAQSSADGKEGIRLVLTARDTTALDELAHELTSASGRVVDVRSVTLDLADTAGLETAGAALWDAFGHLDGLVNNAGISIVGPAVEMRADDWQAVIDMNLTSPALLAAAVGRRMGARGGGRIVNVASVAGSRALADHFAYCTSKAGLIMAGKVLAAELGNQGVRVNSVSPTVVLTEMGTRVWGDDAKAAPMLSRIANGHFAEPDDVASAVAYLLGDGAEMVNGHDLVIDGGFSAI